MDRCNVVSGILGRCEAAGRASRHSLLHCGGHDARHQILGFGASGGVPAEEHERHAGMSSNQEGASRFANGAAVDGQFLDLEGARVREMATVGVRLGVLSDAERQVIAVSAREREATRSGPACQKLRFRMKQHLVERTVTVPVDDQNLRRSSSQGALDGGVHLESGEFARHFVVPAARSRVVRGVDDAGHTLLVGHNEYTHRYLLRRGSRQAAPGRLPRRVREPSRPR